MQSTEELDRRHNKGHLFLNGLCSDGTELFKTERGFFARDFKRKKYALIIGHPRKGHLVTPSEITATKESAPFYFSLLSSHFPHSVCPTLNTIISHHTNTEPELSKQGPICSGQMKPIHTKSGFLL